MPKPFYPRRLSALACSAIRVLTSFRTSVAGRSADAVEMIRHTAFNTHEYYRYLNGGYRLPLVGGTDKMSSEVPGVSTSGRRT